MGTLRSTVERYIDKNNQEFQRYNSWNHCFEAFGKLEDKKLLSLHLAFYLASWGMYRGSSGLLQKDYLVHLGAVNIIKDAWFLRCSITDEVDISCVNEIKNLIELLKKHYNSFQFETSKGKQKNISPTGTLVSKILLGTLGCIPAFDRFFINGVINQQFNFKSLTTRSLIKLFEFSDNSQELAILQKEHPEYPKMKLVDMYFWQIGFENSKS